MTEKMRQANEKMRQYHINRPPIHVLQKSKLRNSRGDQHLYIQLAAGKFLFCFVSLYHSSF